MGNVVALRGRTASPPIKGMEATGMSAMKTCAKCKLVKPATEKNFSPSTSESAKDGLHSYCRPCNVEYQKDYKSRKKNGHLLILEERAVVRRAEITKKCSRCKQVFPKSEFYAAGKGTEALDGFLSACKQCMRDRVKRSARIRDWAERMVATACRRHAAYWPEEEFDLTVEHLREVYAAQGGLCFWFGIELHLGVGSGLQQISLDRADCSCGYTKNNILVTSKAANLARGDASTEEFALLIQRIHAAKEEG